MKKMIGLASLRVKVCIIESSMKGACFFQSLSFSWFLLETLLSCNFWFV